MNILNNVRVINKLSSRYYSRKIGIIGVPFDKGQVSIHILKCNI